MSALASEVKVLVVGAGAMGSGIAQVAAAAGHPVYLFDAREGAAEQGRERIAAAFETLAGKGRMSAEAARAAAVRIEPIQELPAARDAGLAVEAIVEDLAAKRALFAELEGLLADDAIFASNTSSLSITALAAPLRRPERVAGLHFFNPAPVMKLVEVVSGLATDPAVAATLHATARAWGKVAVHAKSTPGFIVNRVARPYYAEALRVLGEGAADVATLDAVLREGCGFPMGPFELMDLIGHDVNFAVTASVFEAHFQDKRYTPSLIQHELVQAGRLGRKSGRGFYDYTPGAARPQPVDEPARQSVHAVAVVGDLGVAAGLIARLEAAGIELARKSGSAERGAGWLEIGSARLMLSDGRTATRRAVEEGVPNLVLFDLCLDYAATPRLAVAAADSCGAGAYRAVVGTLQAAGLAVNRIDDVAGLLGLRTVAMLANEAADAVLAGIGSAADIDSAMRFGTNYPKGPLAWADELGAAYLARVLANLATHYFDTRYRTSPLLQRKALTGATFHA